MNELTKVQTLHVAKLANLKLTDNEINKFSIQLSEVLNFIDELKKVDTKNIEPTSQTTGLTNVKRKDKVDETRILTKEEALSGTDNIQNGYFVVPQIIKK